MYLFLAGDPGSIPRLYFVFWNWLTSDDPPTCNVFECQAGIKTGARLKQRPSPSQGWRWWSLRFPRSLSLDSVQACGSQKSYHTGARLGQRCHVLHALEVNTKAHPNYENTLCYHVIIDIEILTMRVWCLDAPGAACSRGQVYRSVLAGILHMAGAEETATLFPIPQTPCPTAP